MNKHGGGSEQRHEQGRQQMRWTYRLSWKGFGFGAWRNVYYPGDVIWTIAIGILTIHTLYFAPQMSIIGKRHRMGKPSPAEHLRQRKKARADATRWNWKMAMRDMRRGHA